MDKYYTPSYREYVRQTCWNAIVGAARAIRNGAKYADLEIIKRGPTDAAVVDIASDIAQRLARNPEWEPKEVDRDLDS